MPDPSWSTLALWACLDELQSSVITEAAEVRVEQGWVDGPHAFCIIYTPPYEPGHRVGLRHHASDDVEAYVYGLTSVLYLEHIKVAPHEAPLPQQILHPVAFGVAVAAFEIGEPGRPTRYARTKTVSAGGAPSRRSSLPPAPIRCSIATTKGSDKSAEDDSRVIPFRSPIVHSDISFPAYDPHPAIKAPGAV
ncbi:hypothetical protein [Nakamurella panacisegetis]|uniref:hypothetical protein n=1 Tax=Nakamurella panacisegetis TaxID=1090615 RepID=UPI0012FDD386|nr:hypothetical protein [Nakamurella panacisegetis]